MSAALLRMVPLWPRQSARKAMRKKLVSSVKEGELKIDSDSETPIAVDPFNANLPFVAIEDIDYEAGGVQEKAVKGDRSDAGSVPALAQLLLGFLPFDTSLLPTFMHDRGYKFASKSRVILDAMLLTGLRAISYKPNRQVQTVGLVHVVVGAMFGWKAIVGYLILVGLVWAIGAPRVMYFGVRIGGWVPWMLYRRKDAATRLE